jgi:hypothetical protein
VREGEGVREGERERRSEREGEIEEAKLCRRWKLKVSDRVRKR